MIMEVDRKIFNHIEQFQFATITQIQKLFFRTQKYGYNISRRHLNKLEKEKFIKSSRNSLTNEIVFYVDSKYSKVSLHQMYLMNLYCEIAYMGAEIGYFKKEKEWCNGSTRSDGFLVYKLGDMFFADVIEIHVSNNPLNLEKYDTDQFETEIKELSDGKALTRILLMDDVMRLKEPHSDKFKIVKLDFELSDVGKVFIP